GSGARWQFVTLATAASLILTPASVAALNEMAITVDDLPTHGPLPAGMSRVQIARRMLQVFNQHRVPQVYGFAIGTQIHENPDLLPILEEWRAAGYPIGNHTFSHPKLDRVTADEYVADIEANETFLSQFSKNPSFKVFRYPYLAEGDTPEKRKAVRAWLAAHGYHIAQVTVDFDDWAWNGSYARCLAQGDLRAIARLKRSFVETALRRLKWSEEVTQFVLHRPIKHLLLLHVGAFDGVMVDDLLSAYENAGVTFIDPESAMRDDPYGLNPHITWEGGLTFPEQPARAKGVPLPPAPEVPFRQLELLCR
ncbi:MAG TPA: polysaccharide deacetylase family protein, partial [Candidatus Acidoferrum sp.]|nr:polysaccharide deacetylase family protein [Candidatus Acidoferrum sp.]